MLIKPARSANLSFVAREEWPPNRRAFRRYIEVCEGSVARIHMLNLRDEVLSTGKLSTDEIN